MVGRRAQPHVHLLVGIEIDVHQAQQARLVLRGLGDALDQRREIQLHDVQLDAQRRHVLLDHCGDPLARAIAAVRDHARTPPDARRGRTGRRPSRRKPSAASSRFASARSNAVRPQALVEPEQVRRRERPDARRRVTAIDDLAQIVAPDRVGDGLPEVPRPEPGLL